MTEDRNHLIAEGRIFVGMKKKFKKNLLTYIVMFQN